MTSPLTPSQWADAVAFRINAYAIGHWLQTFGQWLGFSDDQWLPATSKEGRVVVPVPHRGIQLQVYRLDSDKTDSGKNGRDLLVLEEAVFNGELITQHPQTGALPFGLDAENDMPDQVTQKIDLYGCYDIISNNAEHSYFLEDARVIGITYHRHLHGIRHVQVIRLGEALPFEKIAAEAKHNNGVSTRRIKAA